MNVQKPTNINLLTQLMKSDPALVAVLKQGDLVQGVVLEKGANRMLVDLGKNGVGVVYRGELQNARDVIRGLNVEDAVHAKVMEVDNEDGYVELSLSEASKQKAWSEVAELQEKGEPMKVKIAGFNKGGLITEIAHLQAFLPVSQLASEHYPKVVDEDKTQIAKMLQQLVGQELEVKIIDVNPRNNKLIVSEREAVEVNTRELAKNYTVGQVIEGIISGVADFGAFVKFTDNPALEGLIHVSELDHRVVENPKEIVKVDDVVKAKITEIKDGKISLSLKALKDDPWLTAEGRYKEGQEIRGIIYSFNPFGATVNLDGGIQGQVHVTAFGGVEEMKKELVTGKEYVFEVESIKIPERRINLKLKK